MSKTKRTTRLVITNVTREQMEDAFAEYAKASARKDQIIAKRELEFAKIREKTQDEVAQLDEILIEKTDILQAFANENKQLFTPKQKHIKTTHGNIGFRTGTPKLKTLKGFTWEAVKNLAKQFLPDYIRVEEEVAKDKILSDRDEPTVIQNLSKIGVFVDQDESFYVEVKKEEVTTA